MSTASHPQTDGLNERANRTVEDMLRAYVSPHHNDWDQHLTAVTRNNSHSHSDWQTKGHLSTQCIRSEQPSKSYSSLTDSDLWFKVSLVGGRLGVWVSAAGSPSGIFPFCSNGFNYTHRQGCASR